MSPSGSDTPSPARSEPGFTLAEIVIAVTVASILSVVVVRFYKDSYKAYSVSEQLAERNQNAHFVLNRFVEVLQQAGSSLPDSGWSNTLRKSGSTLIVGVNPRGAEHFVGKAAGINNFVAVSDAAMFANTSNVLLNTTHVLIDYLDPAKPTQSVAIDAGYGSFGFTKGIKNNATGLDSLYLKTAVTLAVGDRIFGYREDYYLLSGGNLIIQPNGDAAAQLVLAENIDSLGVSFLDANGGSASLWKNMRSASLVVRARTNKPDPNLPPPGYRKITLPMNVILRNRI